MLKLTVKKSNSLSIHVQLREQLKHQIETGVLKPGTRLHAIRKMAADLGINYNTVRAVFKELNHQGFITTVQGSGTIVSNRKYKAFGKINERLDQLIHEVSLEAKSTGLSSEDVLLRIYSSFASMKSGAQRVRLLFLECNEADLQHHLENIHKTVGIKSEGCLFSHLKRKKSAFLNKFNLIATTMYHLADAKELVEPYRHVLGLVVQPSISEVVANIASLPSGTNVALICVTREKAKKMQEALIGNGLTQVTFLTSGLNETNRLKSVLDQSDEIYVSRMGLASHRGPWPTSKPIQKYVDDLDQRAIAFLRQKINSLKLEPSSIRK